MVMRTEAGTPQEGFITASLRQETGPLLADLGVLTPRQRQQAERLRRRTTAFVDPNLLMQHLGMSALETRAVRDNTFKQYRKHLQDFVAWGVRTGAWYQNDQELDAWLTVWCDELFYRGVSVEVASQTVAALKHFLWPLRKGGASSTALPSLLRPRI